MKFEPASFNPSTQRSRLYSLGKIAYRYRYWAIALWTLLMVFSLWVLPLLEQVLTETGAVYEAGQAHRAEQQLQKELAITSDAVTLVFQRTPPPLVKPDQSEASQSEAIQAEIGQLLQRIQVLPVVTAVASAAEHPEYRSADGQTQYSLIFLNLKRTEATNSAIAQVEAAIHQHSLPHWNTFLTGAPVVYRDIQKISKTDLTRVELMVLPLTLVALLVVFGSVVAAILPIVMAVIAVSVTFGLLYLISLHISVSVFALNLASMLGLGLGIDYSLLIVNRFREELQLGSREEAIAQTLDTAGRAVLFSGLTVCIGLICLLLFPIALLQSLGLAGALVVMLSVMTALTLLPALLGIVGDRVRQRAVASHFAPRWQQFWATLARRVIRHSVLATLVVLLIVAGLTAPFLRARFALVSADILPKDFPARRGAEIIQQAFGAGEISPILLLLQTQSAQDAILSERHLKALYDLVNRLKADPRVERVNSLLNLEPDLPLSQYQQFYQSATPSQLTVVVKPAGSDATIVFKSQTTGKDILTTLPNQLQSWKLDGLRTWATGQTSTLIVVKSRTAGNQATTRSLVKDIRAWKLAGLNLWVAGQTAKELDTIEVVYRYFPWVLLVLIGTTFVILWALLDSIILPLKAIALNTLSIGASFGALVFIFQDGNWHQWLDFTPVGYLDLLLPVVLFCVLFGLSMDYEVFLLTRIKEAYDQTHNNTESVIQGLQFTGGIITSAAFLMIIVSSAFVMTRIIFVKALGLGSAIAVLLDITLIRAILVPASMHLLGNWNWWSGRGKGGREIGR